MKLSFAIERSGQNFAHHTRSPNTFPELAHAPGPQRRWARGAGQKTSRGVQIPQSVPFTGGASWFAQRWTAALSLLCFGRRR